MELEVTPATVTVLYMTVGEQVEMVMVERETDEVVMPAEVEDDGVEVALVAIGAEAGVGALLTTLEAASAV